MNIGVIGCGNICDVYFKNCKRFADLKVVGCSDLQADRAKAKAELHGIPRAGCTEELLGSPDVEMVINLTRPESHYEVNLDALNRGKHVYSEKPLATRTAEGKELLDAARRHNVRLGCAPDTFMGAGLQTCRKAVDSGMIGVPVGATAFMMYPGHETWHPDPEFFYRAGGGPVFDMGPYYITSLVHLFGPVRRVVSSAKATHARRVIQSGPKTGTEFPVTVPTHVAAILDFESGATATLMVSFDGWYHHLPVMELYGTEGSISVPDPNAFGGPVRVRRARSENWVPVPISHGYEENSRGVGAADLVLALREKRPHRASAEMAYHVLEVMEACHESSLAGRHIEIQSRCERPEPMKEGLAFGQL